jgi:hypothetical protein
MWGCFVLLIFRFPLGHVILMAFRSRSSTPRENVRPGPRGMETYAGRKHLGARFTPYPYQRPLFPGYYSNTL